MNRFPLWALCAAVPMLAMELKIDHVTVAGRNLTELRKAFDAIGLVSEPGGKHINGMTEMAIASFPDGSYLELIAAQPGASAAKHDWGAFIEHDGGACAWAVAVTDIAAEARRLGQVGVPVAPVAGGRQRPDGTPLRWINAGLGPGPHGSFFPFLIQDQTPRELRVYALGKPTVSAMGGVALVVIAVRDLDGAVAKWRATFSLGEPRRQSDATLKARVAWFPGTPVVLAAADGETSWVAGRLRDFGEAPFAFLFRAKSLPSGTAGDRTKWFGREIGWFDPARVLGARIGVIVER